MRRGSGSRRLPRVPARQVSECHHPTTIASFSTASPPVNSLSRRRASSVHGAARGCSNIDAVDRRLRNGMVDRRARQHLVDRVEPVRPLHRPNHVRRKPWRLVSQRRGKGSLRCFCSIPASESDWNVSSCKLEAMMPSE